MPWKEYRLSSNRERNAATRSATNNSATLASVGVFPRGGKRKKERKEEKKAITLLHCIPDSKSNLGKVSARGEGGEENQRPLFRIFGLEFQTVFRVTSQKKEREREEKKKTGSFHGRNVRYRWPWREKRVPVSRSQLFDILYDCSTSFLPVPPPFIRIIAYRKVSYRYFENL